jgi:hypothetical protein
MNAKPTVETVLNLARANPEFSMPGFPPPTIIPPGECYHYTFWWQMIEKEKMFRGAPLEAKSISCTQFGLTSEQAKELIGIVFAYGTLYRCLKEASNKSDVVKIKHKGAVAAYHGKEVGIRNGGSPTLMILSTDIEDFTCEGNAAVLRQRYPDWSR